MKLLSYSCTIKVPIEKSNLYSWLINITEEEYKSFAKGHRAIGLCKKENAEGMVNIESIGGNLLIQH